MAKIGSLRSNGDNAYEGNLETLEIKLDDFLVESNPLQTSPNQPSHVIKVQKENGQKIEIGASWKKTLKRGKNVGKDYFFISIDFPEMLVPLAVNAFPTDKDGIFDIVWSRPKPKPTVDIKEAANDNKESQKVDSQAPIDDEIPF